MGQAADVLTTELGLNYGVGWEANPLIALSQAQLGADWWVPKFVLIALMGIAVLASRVRRIPVALVIAGSWIPPAINLLQLVLTQEVRPPLSH